MTLWKVIRVQTAIMNESDYDIPDWCDDESSIEEWMNDMGWNLNFIDFSTVDQYVEKVME